MGSYHTTSVPSLSQAFLQCMPPENTPSFLPCAQRGTVRQELAVMLGKNLGFRCSLVAVSPPRPDSASLVAPGVVPAWLIPRKRMEQSGAAGSSKDDGNRSWLTWLLRR